MSVQMIDKDNLKSEESVGTFRWNNDLKLIDVPKYDNSMRSILLQLKDGWKTYCRVRFQSGANQDGEINIEPH